MKANQANDIIAELSALRAEIGRLTAHTPINDDTSGDALVSTAIAARFLGFSPSTLQSERSRGRGPRWVRIGVKSIRYRVEDLRRFARGEA